MSLIEFVPETQTPGALADALTHLPPDFTQQVLEPNLNLAYYPVSNDRRLGYSYYDMVQETPQPDPGKTGVVLIVGNGAIETAAQVLPEDAIVLHCDYNPRTLFLMRATKELMANCVDVGEFTNSLSKLECDLWGKPYVTGLHGAGLRYDNQEQYWCYPDVEHFLSTQVAFDAAKDAVARRQFAYHWLNLKKGDQIQHLGQTLRDNDCQVIAANVTNAFDVLYAGRIAAEVFTAEIPLHPDGFVAFSCHGNNLRSEGNPVKGWLDFLDGTPGYL